MQDLIILGLVPGTHIQINFVIWLYSVAILTALANFWLAYRTRLVKSLIVTTFLVVNFSRHRRLTLS